MYTCILDSTSFFQTIIIVVTNSIKITCNFLNHYDDLVVR